MIPFDDIFTNVAPHFHDDNISSSLDPIKIGLMDILGWQLSNCGFFLENQRQFFHGTK